MFVALLAYLIQGMIFGSITRYVAESNGYDGGFCWGFFLGIIGLLVVGFRPNLTGSLDSLNNSAYWDHLQENASGSSKSAMWRCVCGTENPVTLNYCVRCRRNRSELNKEDRKKCPHCGAMNRKSNTVCFACNRPLKEEKQPEQDVKPTATQQEALSLLKNLGELHQQGVLTDDEFFGKEKQILSRI